jgi:hypothetical protein
MTFSSTASSHEHPRPLLSQLRVKALTMQLTDADMQHVVSLLRGENNSQEEFKKVSQMSISIPNVGRVPLSVCILFRCIASFERWYTCAHEGRTGLSSLPDEHDVNKRFFFACTGKSGLDVLQPGFWQEGKDLRTETACLRGDELISRMFKITEAELQSNSKFTLGGLSIDPSPNRFTIFAGEPHVSMLKFWADAIFLERSLKTAVQASLLEVQTSSHIHHTLHPYFLAGRICPAFMVPAGPDLSDS